MDGDVIMVNADPFKMTTARELERMPHLNAICGMAILTMRGSCLGSLADLVLEDQGTRVTGYVVTPTAFGEQTLPYLEDIAPLSVGVEQASANGGRAAPRMRVIPVSGHVRIGESLILLVAEVTPLREDVVIVSQTVSGDFAPQN
jgi:sporulation protein YlmC with PRC-barrel domain